MERQLFDLELIHKTHQSPPSSFVGGFFGDYAGEYSYDEMGNMEFDAHKEMAIHYNHLQMVDQIDFIDVE